MFWICINVCYVHNKCCAAVKTSSLHLHVCQFSALIETVCFCPFWLSKLKQWQLFQIGTVDVLRACDACADMRTAYSIFSIVQCTDSVVFPKAVIHFLVQDGIVIDRCSKSAVLQLPRYLKLRSKWLFCADGEDHSAGVQREWSLWGLWIIVTLLPSNFVVAVCVIINFTLDKVTNNFWQSQ